MPDACPQDAFTARGHIVLSKNTRFKHLEFSFPLKWMAPRLHSTLPDLGVCYVLSSRGGLVSGDTVLLRVEVEPECSLLLLTQVRKTLAPHERYFNPYHTRALPRSSR
jgi:hypothetical protein